jgi:hypothetical protein
MARDKQIVIVHRSHAEVTPSWYANIVLAMARYNPAAGAGNVRFRMLADMAEGYILIFDVIDGVGEAARWDTIGTIGRPKKSKWLECGSNVDYWKQAHWKPVPSFKRPGTGDRNGERRRINFEALASSTGCPRADHLGACGAIHVLGWLHPVSLHIFGCRQDILKRHTRPIELPAHPHLRYGPHR